jgi:hypothetical protein
MKISLIKLFSLVLTSSLLLNAEDSLTCEPNAISYRDFSFEVQQWGDGITLDKSSDKFGTTTKEDGKGVSLKTIVFSHLNTNSPSIKRVQTYDDGKSNVSNFEAKVISLSKDFILLKWQTPADDKWIASINTKYKKAIITNNYNGTFSFGATTYSLDCK